jgi:hypothetical protein
MRNSTGGLLQNSPFFPKSFGACRHISTALPIAMEYTSVAKVYKNAAYHAACSTSRLFIPLPSLAAAGMSHMLRWLVSTAIVAQY